MEKITAGTSWVMLHLGASFSLAAALMSTSVTRGSNESSRRAYGITRRPSTPCCIGIVRAIDELPGETRTSQDIWQMIGLA